MFVVVLINFWGQKAKAQGHNRQWAKNTVNTISQTSEGKFTPFWSHVFGFTVKSRGHRKQWPEILGSPQIQLSIIVGSEWPHNVQWYH